VKLFSEPPCPTSTTVGLVPDATGRRILYASDNLGDEQFGFYLLDTVSADTRPVLIGCTDRWVPVAVSPDGRNATFLSDYGGSMNLWRVALDGTKQVVLPLGGIVVGGGKWSPDSQWITASVSHGPGCVGIVASVDGRQSRRVVDISRSSVDSIVDWSPCGQYIAFASRENDVVRLGVMDLQNGLYMWLNDGGPERGVEFSPSGRYVLACAYNPAGDSLVVYDRVSGERSSVGPTDGQVVYSSFVTDNEVVAVRSSDRSPPQIIKYNISLMNSSVVYPTKQLPKNSFVQCMNCKYVSSDGTTVPSLLYVPGEQAPPEGWSAVVVLHGGPGDHFRRGFDPYAQFFAKMNFVVLEANIRGSSGFGRKHQEAIRGAWGQVDLLDVIGAHAYLTTLAEVNPKRIALFGSSYGAFLAARAIALQPDLWSSAIVWGGFYDFIELLESSTEYTRRILKVELGDAFRDEGILRTLSPIGLAVQITCPLLIMHGQYDTRVPIAQARRFFEELQHAKRDKHQTLEFVELLGEGHIHTNVAHSVRLFEVMANFLRRNVTGQA